MIADILVFVFVLLFVYTGYKAGLIKTLYGLVSYFLAILLSVMLYPHVSAYISGNTGIYNAISNLAEGLAISEDLSDKYNPLIEYVFPAVDNVVNTAVTGLLINIISFVAVLIISRFILAFISKSLNIVSKLPIISTLNKIGGAIIGGFKGVLILYIIFLIILLFPEIGNGKVAENIASSQIANKFYTENLIIDILGKDVLNINGK